jgi:hypothetical protein
MSDDDASDLPVGDGVLMHRAEWPNSENSHQSW